MFGTEIELIDFDRKNITLPRGCYFSKTEIDLVNSDGNAINPYNYSPYTIGGEVCTKPTKTIKEQVDIFKDCIKRTNGGVNYRCQLHIHISKDKGKFSTCRDQYSLGEIKRILKYSQENYAAVNYFVWKMHEKLPEMKSTYYEAAVSKIYKMPDYMYEFCMNAVNMEDLKSCWFKNKKGSFSPLVFRRYYVNIYSIFKHGTIEFRIFRPTLDEKLVKHCLKFSEEFIRHALTDRLKVVNWIEKYRLPDPLPFNKELEQSYQLTKVKKK